MFSGRQKLQGAAEVEQARRAICAVPAQDALV